MEGSGSTPVCGCGKPWPASCIKYGAQCIGCGQNSPPPPPEPAPEPRGLVGKTIEHELCYPDLDNGDYHLMFTDGSLAVFRVVALYDGNGSIVERITRARLTPLPEPS